MPLPARRPSTASRTSASGARCPGLDAEGARQLGVRRPGRRGRPGGTGRSRRRTTCRPGSALKRECAVAEAAVGVGEGAHARERAVPDPHRGDRLGDLLAVGADVLDRGRADRAGDAGQRLDADPAALDGAGDQVVPGLPRGDRDQRRRRRRRRRSTSAVDARGRDLDDACRRSPSSATTRLLPPPSTSTGSPAASAAATASTSSSSVVGRRPRPGPGRRGAGWCGRPSSVRHGTHAPSACRAPSGPSQVTVEGDRGEAVVDLLDLAGDLDLDAARRRGTTTGLVNLQPKLDAPRRRGNQSSTARAASAIVYMPCAITPGSPTLRATSSSWWIGLWSPLAAA